MLVGRIIEERGYIWGSGGAGLSDTNNLDWMTGLEQGVALSLFVDAENTKWK